MSEFGELGNQNRKFLKGIYQPKPTEIFMKVNSSPQPLPSKCDLRNICGLIDIYNQGSLGSCTANAIAGAYKILALIKYNKYVSISRLFVYYNEIVMIGKIFEDSGAFIKDGFLSMQSQGACLEKFWPYNENQFRVMPSLPCYNEARLHRTHSYNSQLDPTDMVQSIKQSLALNLPVVIGVLVYESFQSDQAARTGFIPYPNTQTEKLLGGHALCCVGYDDNANHFIVLNSWGQVWGDRGFCYIPYPFIANNNLCNDCHAFFDVELRLVGEEDSHDLTFNCFSPKIFNSCNVT